VRTDMTRDSTHNSPTERHGTLIVSLDFELYWGVRHLASAGRYQQNLVGARAAVPALLNLFTEYEIHATWATVGFLFFDRTEALVKCAPKLRPKYRKGNLSPYLDLPPKEARETSDSVFFARSLVRAIANTPNQEIGSHTFSHYYCLEQGHDVDSFEEDLLAARFAARPVGRELRSLVFPQNQVQEEFLDACYKAGIVAYRGNPESWFYRACSESTQGYARRLGRLADAYVPLVATCYPFPMPSAQLPINLPASRFLRPYSRVLRILEPLRLRRIIRELTHAAQAGLCYHLWWHPHNFGIDTAANLGFLRKILEHYLFLRDHYGMKSANMGEAADLALNWQRDKQKNASESGT
jgi:peptidoglycan/xylan/chitin deacetylase (PgdA/CDA1 family)